MTMEKMTREVAERRLAEVAPKVADILGLRIVPRDDRHLVEMKSPTERHGHVYLNVGYDGGYGSVSVGGSWPRDEEGRQVSASYDLSKLPRIKVSLSREPTSIAREVERRFLPEYVPLWEAAVARIKSERTYRGGVEEKALALAKICGAPRSEIKDGKFSLYRSTKFPESLSEVEVHGDDVRLDLRCTFEEATEILKVLAG